MEFNGVKKRQRGNSELRDAVYMDGDVLKHFQIETRNGFTFMRMKTRNVSPADWL